MARAIHKPHRFRPSRANPTLCARCACTLGKPWHLALETTDAAPYETTALIPKVQR